MAVSPLLDLGMIEDKSDDLRIEYCDENVKTSEVLLPLINNHVAEESQLSILIRYWRAYLCSGRQWYTACQNIILESIGKRTHS